MNKVERLREIKTEINRLREEERELSIPIVANMGMIRNLYDIFTLSLKKQDAKADPHDTGNRKKFLYLILYVCSPATLVGGAIRHRLRECLTPIVGCTPTGVTRDYKTALFFYETYKNFRDSVDLIIKDTLELLGKKDK